MWGRVVRVVIWTPRAKAFAQMGLDCQHKLPHFGKSQHKCVWKNLAIVLTFHFF
jgi:hypothetical protein